MYYLNSRYYNPEIGRFINADSLIDNRGLITQNLFSYCSNNPVNYSDQNGNIAARVVSGLVGGLIGGASGAITASANGENALKGAVVGFATGFVTSVFCGFVGGKVIELAKAGNIVKAGATLLAGSAGIGFATGVINTAGQAIEYVNKTINKDQSVEDVSIVEYINEEDVIYSAKVAAVMAPLAIISSGAVDSAFINPKTFDIVSDAVGYGIANAYMGGNVSLIQSIIEIF